jgi:tetratricopeptide (TPR) repeat protein
MIRRLCALGGLFAAALGCNRNATQSPYGQMPDAGGTQVVRMPVGGSNKLFGGSNGASVPVEMAPDPAASKKPLSAETLVALADTQFEAAMDERTVPGSKEALLDRARTGYQRALKADPKSKAALRAMAQYYARVGERDKALEMYKRYLTLYPEAGVAHDVAIAHARWKDMPGAVGWCEYALKIDPENRDVKKTMGFCLARCERWDEAFATLCQIMPEAQARHNLAGMLDQMGHTDASKVQLQLALKADPNFAPSVGWLVEMEQPHDPNAVRQAADTQPAPTP